MQRRLFPGIYEGWLVVGSSALFVIVLAGTIVYGFGTVFKPIQDEFGWTAAAMSVAFSVRSQGTGIAAPFVGIMIDRIGPRITMLFGVLTLVAGVFILSFMQSIWV